MCATEGIPCRMRGHRFCLTDTTLYCNGIANCDDGIDEDPRMCDKGKHHGYMLPDN